MHVTSLRWQPRGAWSQALPAALEGANLVLYFAAPELMGLQAGPVRELVQTVPAGAVCAGCSTSGEIFGAQVSDGTVSVLAMRFEHTCVKPVLVTMDTEVTSERAGQRIAESLEGDLLRFILVLSDGLSVNGSQLTRALRERLPAGVVVCGGLAGDGDRFGRTQVGLAQNIGPGRVLAIGFYGERFRVSSGSAGGWQAFGPKRLITGAQANVLRSLDNQPALSLYSKYLGDRASGLPATGLLFPLQLLSDNAAESGLVRTILAMDTETQSLTFAGDMPEGAYARLMRAGLDALVDGAGQAAEMAQGLQVQGDSAAILVSCVGRKLVMGQRVEEEVEAVLGTLGPSVQAAGFYSYGEISPAGCTQNCELHNQTMTLSVFGEI